jgi:hypothetical protein
MIKITLETIREHHPCADGWKKVKAANDDQPFPVSSILDSNGLDDTLWVLRCLPEHNQLWRKFACWCALENIELIKPYTDKYDLIVDYLNNPDADSAYNVARAVHGVVRSAYDDDDDDAAYDAAYAAYAATAAYAAYAYAAYGAAARAAYDTARAKQKQANKLRQILDTGEWVE